MYNISEEALNLFKNNYRQIVRITIERGNQRFELDESNIIQGGLSIDRYCLSNDKIEIGSAIASELSLKLDNRNDQFEETRFEGAEIKVEIGIKKWDALKWENAQIHWIPCGYFTVDDTPRKLAYIDISALDRMVKFDVEVNKNDISFPITVGEMLSLCCQICGVELATNTSTLTNVNYVIQHFPAIDDIITYRQLIQWIAEITGTCAYIDWDGKLQLQWYENTNTIVSPSDRFNSDLYEDDIIITGVQVIDSDGIIHLSGTDDYAFNIKNNELIQNNYEDIASSLNAKLNGFSYRPYSCSCKPLPHIYPLDKIKYIDKKGNEYSTIITSVNFKLNSSTAISAKGKTYVKNSYASQNPFTKEESVVIKKVERDIDKKIEQSERENTTLNELIGNSFGLYHTGILKEDGSIEHYYHDAQNLTQSSIVYTFKSNGFAWTKEYRGSQTVWNYGITKEGNGILNTILANKITAEYIDASDLQANSILVKDSEDTPIFSANASEKKIVIGNFEVTSDGFISIGDDGQSFLLLSPTSGLSMMYLHWIISSSQNESIPYFTGFQISGGIASVFVPPLDLNILPRPKFPVLYVKFGKKIDYYNSDTGYIYLKPPATLGGAWDVGFEMMQENETGGVNNGNY